MADEVSDGEHSALCVSGSAQFWFWFLVAVHESERSPAISQVNCDK